MSLIAIETALEDHLKTFAGLLPVAYENTTFKPPADKKYIAVHHLHNVPRDLSIERDLTEYPGIFQMTLNFPGGQGKAAAKIMAQQLADHFEPGTYLEAGNHLVQINDTPYIASGYPDDDGSYRIPISVNWQAYPANNP